MSLFRFLKSVRNSDMDRIKSFYFCYSTGCMRFSSVSYGLNEKKGRYFATVSPDGEDPEKPHKYEVDDGFASELTDILKRNKVGRWNGYRKIDKDVLDGTGFSLNVHFFSGKYLRASGYMMTPKNYNVVCGEIEACFMRLFNEE